VINSNSLTVAVTVSAASSTTAASTVLALGSTRSRSITISSRLTYFLNI